MEQAIDALEQERERLVTLMKDGDGTVLGRKTEIDHAIHWLRKIHQLRLPRAGQCHFIQLPDVETGYSFFRVVNDCETDDRERWIDLDDDNGNRIVLAPGDYLVDIRR